MAKASKVVASDGIDKELLSKIVTATASGPTGFEYVSQVQGQPMLAHNPPLIMVNTGMVDPNDGTRVAARSTDAATAYLAASAAPVTEAAPATAHKYEIIIGAVLPPPKKRGNTVGSGAPTKYPFADLPVGGTFFSANSEHAKGDAVKALGSTVSSQNRKYGEPDGDKTKVLKRAKRGPDKKPIMENGKKVIEEKTVPVLKYSRKFTIRPVVKGEMYGTWEAPEDGALIGRAV